MTESFLKALERTAFNINQDNRIVAEVSGMETIVHFLFLHPHFENTSS